MIILVSSESRQLLLKHNLLSLFSKKLQENKIEILRIEDDIIMLSFLHLLNVYNKIEKIYLKFIVCRFCQ